MRQTRPGFSLVELMITLGLFALVSLVSIVLMARSGDVWRGNSAEHTVQLEMNRVTRAVQPDFEAASKGSIQVAKVPGSLSGGPDGDVVWFLSARDESTSEFRRGTEGRPVWQRNVLYYLVIPENHNSLAGFGCSASPTLSNDSFCPHKVLIRKVINSPPDPAQAAANPSLAEQSLVTDISPYLTRPQGLNASAMLSEPGVESARVVASKLLCFEVDLQPDEVTLDVRAIGLEGLGRTIKVGSVALKDQPQTRQLLLSLFPKNP